jgi:hypothetical protein
VIRVSHQPGVHDAPDYAPIESGIEGQPVRRFFATPERLYASMHRAEPSNRPFISHAFPDRLQARLCGWTSMMPFQSRHRNKSAT